MQHVIKKQTINLYFSGTGRAAAFRVQQELSRHYWQEILPEMEVIFDGSSTESEMISIDRLEIDLGQLTLSMLTGDRLPASLMDTIRDQLYASIRAAVASGRVQPVTVNIYRHWLFYMQHGYIPWNTIRVTDKWYASVLEALATDHESVMSLIALIQTDAVVLYRITEQHKDEFLINLAGILAPHSLVDLPAMINEMVHLLDRWVRAGIKLRSSYAIKSGDRGIRSLIWREVLQQVARQQPGLSSERLAQSILTQLVAEEDRTSIAQHLPSEFAILPTVVKEWEQHGYDVSDSTELPPTSAIDQTEDQTVMPEEDTIFVGQAGSVLLHPFLSALFSRLQLVVSGEFKDPVAKQKGLYLIHYLATGSGEAQEHELVIPKVLCQYAFHLPVDSATPFTREETAEADHLLEEVIRQWEVLKSTTVGGLRDGFLKRPGKLSRRHGHWRLQVENNAIDVLLDQLPWNLNVIKLPWMKELLMVEWR